MKTVELYTDGAVLRLEKKYRIWRTAILAFLIAALIVCVVSVALTKPTNVRYTRPVVLITSAVAGSVAIYAVTFPVLGSKRTAQHARLMLKDEKEYVTGAAEVRGRAFRIRGSVTVRPVTIVTADGEENVRVDADLAKLVPADGKIREYTVVHGYITAYGEAEDEKIS